VGVIELAKRSQNTFIALLLKMENIDDENEEMDQPSDVVVVPYAPLMGYPLNYFDPKTGKGPANIIEAELWWKYRHDRPIGLLGTFDSTPKGEQMLTEISECRESLRDFITDELVYGFLEGFRELQITTPHDNQTPQFGPDMKRIMKDWSNTIENQRIVFTIFHSFHISRRWLSATVDKYLLNWNMFLYPDDTITDKKKQYSDNRGGWGTVARRAKAQTLRKYMNYIMNTQGWMISTTKSARKESSHHYTVVTYGEYYNQIVNHPQKDKTLFYVVTKKNIMTEQRLTLGKNLDSFFNINYHKLMNDIINAQEQCQSYTLPPDVLRDLVVGNSKLNKKKLNKLIFMTSNGNGDDNHDSSSNESDGDDDDKDDDDKENDEDDNDDDNNDDNSKKMLDAKSPKKTLKNVSVICVLIFYFNILNISC
jgi:hypothetical protein